MERNNSLSVFRKTFIQEESSKRGWSLNKKKQSPIEDELKPSTFNSTKYIPHYRIAPEFYNVSVGKEKNEEHRDYMEDYVVNINNFGGQAVRYLFCIFDGHGGEETAKLCSQQYPNILNKCLKENSFDYEKAIKTSFDIMDKELEKSNLYNDIGNTATVVFLHNKLLYCANVGDSSCIYINSKEAKMISIDDNTSNKDEVKRIQSMGGVIEDERLDGILAITRGMGDFSLKKKGLISTPHISRLLLDSYSKYCIIASDGVWDVLDVKEVKKICEQYVDAEKISEQIISESLKKESYDNISCIVIDFSKKNKKSEKRTSKVLSKFAKNC